MQTSLNRNPSSPELIKLIFIQSENFINIKVYPKIEFDKQFYEQIEKESIGFSILSNAFFFSQ
jgi:polyisoprenoid-binding protein YceI